MNRISNDLIGSLINDRYQVLQFIGEGGMQKVYKTEDMLMKRIVVIKSPKNMSAEKRFKRSAVVSAKVNHPNVAKTLDYFEIGSNLYLIEEFVDGHDLQKAILKRLSIVDPYLAARIFLYLAKGIAASHHVGVIHRDLKPTNVMVSGEFNLSAIKITDFGIAKMAEEELIQAIEGRMEESISNSSTAVGALPYMSPEMIDGPRSVSKATDIWSAGAMMYELLSGHKPFGIGLKAVPKILSGELPPEPEFIKSGRQFSPLGNDLYNLILECIKMIPKDRLTADQLVMKCEQLCYPISERRIGVVRRFTRNNQGFIQDEASEEDVFFHFDSVYGKKPELNDKVCFSKFPASPSPRAHPIIVMTEEKS